MKFAAIVTATAALALAGGTTLSRVGDTTIIKPTHTPGAVTHTSIAKLCTPGYSSRIRPPVSYTERLKILQLSEFGYDDQHPSHYEEDHFVPLSLGGSPRSERNLWPEPWGQAHAADRVEYATWRALCNGNETLAEARRVVVNWKRGNG